MYFLPTILPCSGQYSGQRVHKKIQKILLTPEINALLELPRL
jgi:hypothetical protein